MDLIPSVDLTDLTQKIEKNNMNSVEWFINSYNDGMINTRNDRVTELANEISDSFKNVEIKKKKFIVSSATETRLAEIISSLETVWSPLAVLQREASHNKDSIEGNRIYFSNKVDNGMPLQRVEEIKDNEYTMEEEISYSYEKISDVYVFDVSKSSDFYQRFKNDLLEVEVDDGEDLVVSISVETLLSYDFNFIEDLETII